MMENASLNMYHVYAKYDDISDNFKIVRLPMFWIDRVSFRFYYEKY